MNRNLPFQNPQRTITGSPQDTVYLWGIWLPFTVRIILWYYEALFLVFPYEVLCHCERKTGDPKRYLYFWGKGANEQKTNK